MTTTDTGAARRPGRRAPLDPAKLREERERALMTIDELAERAGMSASHLSGIERSVHGASPSAVRDLAAALKIPRAQTAARLLT